MWLCQFSYIHMFCIYWFLMRLRQSTRSVVVRQTWDSPLVPDSPENSNNIFATIGYILLFSFWMLIYTFMSQRRGHRGNAGDRFRWHRHPPYVSVKYTRGDARPGWNTVPFRPTVHGVWRVMLVSTLRHSSQADVMHDAAKKCSQMISLFWHCGCRGADPVLYATSTH
jgi:hypothetical protein